MLLFDSIEFIPVKLESCEFLQKTTFFCSGDDQSLTFVLKQTKKYDSHHWINEYYTNQEFSAFICRICKHWIVPQNHQYIVTELKKEEKQIINFKLLVSRINDCTAHSHMECNEGIRSFIRDIKKKKKLLKIMTFKSI